MSAKNPPQSCVLHASHRPGIRQQQRAPIGLAAGLASVMLAGASHAQQPQGTELPTVDVEAQQDTGYQATNVGVPRMPVPIRDTPQTVNVITQQVIQEQKAATVLETLRNSPGLTFNAGEGGTQGDNINIRGYTARNDFFRDGVRDPGWYTRDAFSIQQVEVLKGPSSFLFGRGSTGGVVNMTSKLPQHRNFVDVEATGNSVGGHREVIDANRMLSDTVDARLTVLGTQSKVPGRDFTEVNRAGVSAALAAQVTDKTKVTFHYLFQKDDNIPDYGIIMLPGSWFGRSYGQPAPVPRNTSYQQIGGPLGDVEQIDAHIGTVKIEHEFAPNLKLTNTTRYTDVDRFTRVRAVQANYTTSPNVWNAATGGTNIGAAIPQGYPLSNLWVANTNHFQNNTINTLTANQTDLVAKFDTGIVRHTMVTGLEASYETREHYRAMITGDDRVNVASPNNFPANPGVLAPTTALTEGTAQTTGAYLADQMKITDYFELLAGLRYDSFRGTQRSSTLRTSDLTFMSAGNPAYLTSGSNFLSYRVGAVVHPIKEMSLYYMHGTSANPPAEFVTLTNGQQSLAPVENETDEVGIKQDILGGRATVTGAVFRTVQKNAYENLGTNAAPNYVAIGQTRVQGAEVGLVGRITRAWNVMFGYTYLDSRVTNTATPANLGHELANTPNHSGSIWTTYDITPKWTIGGGAFYVGDRWTSTANQFIAPAYWRFDAMASYKVTDDFLVQFNVYNIADTTNYESLAGAGWAVPGPSRYFAITGRYRFK